MRDRCVSVCAFSIVTLLVGPIGLLSGSPALEGESDTRTGCITAPTALLVTFDKQLSHVTLKLQGSTLRRSLPPAELSVCAS